MNYPNDETDREYFQEFPTGKFPETPAGVENWIRMRLCDPEDDALFPDWPRNLFSRKTSEIMQFIEDRFHRTEDRKEYYCSLVHLQGSLPENERYMPFPEKVKGSSRGLENALHQHTRKTPNSTPKATQRGSVK